MPAYEDELQCLRRIVAESLRWLDEAHKAKRHGTWRRVLLGSIECMNHLHDFDVLYRWKSHNVVRFFFFFDQDLCTIWMFCKDGNRAVLCAFCTGSLHNLDCSCVEFSGA